MKLSYQYRIYPNKKQIENLEKTFGFCRFMYNCALQEKISFYKTNKKSLSYNTQAGELLEVKKEFSKQTDLIYSQTLQAVLKRLDAAYQGFFKRVKSGIGKAGFPRFKNKDRFRSICFPQCNLKSGGVKLLENGKVKIFGIKDSVKIVLHRPLQGKCKQVFISKRGDKWFLTASCDEVPKNILPYTGKITAIDLGLNSFITTDQGVKLLHPKPYKTSKEKLAFWQRKLALKQRGSNNRKKVKKQLSRAYENITNIREDFLHKTANKLIRENDLIIVEKLNIQSMMEQKGYQVNKGNIQDASWGNCVSKLNYKAERAGRAVIEVDPANTSRMCSSCGNIKKELKLSDRTYCCKVCGLKLDRDHNAALNILRLGMSLAAI